MPIYKRTTNDRVDIKKVEDFYISKYEEYFSNKPFNYNPI